ncbi:hypothetical protein [Mesorhizobium sp.]|uniref:hypothetical protein n=1 Tax=Mesorhizobium sp. TaxID=1871066 RepID=UPI00257A3815|nr:hypothetical protein [Mesorhizobium sp.]
MLSESKQGVISLNRVTIADSDPETPWIPGEETITSYSLLAVVQRLHQRYETGVLVVETGDVVTFAVPPEMPLLVIDGQTSHYKSDTHPGCRNSGGKYVREKRS